MIYVIGESRTGIVKIGKADDPAKRLREIQVGNPNRLQVLASFAGDRREEAQLHKRFAERRKVGEWFDFGEDDAVVAVAVATARIAITTPAPTPTTPQTPDPPYLEALQRDLPTVFGEETELSVLEIADALLILHDGTWIGFADTFRLMRAVQWGLESLGATRVRVIRDGFGRKGYGREDALRVIGQDFLGMARAHDEEFEQGMEQWTAPMSDPVGRARPRRRQVS